MSSRSLATIALAVLTSLVAASCGSTRAALKEMTRDSCEARCAEAHDDSLYDENRCREDCEPPEVER